jgi:hypothetical protein
MPNGRGGNLTQPLKKVLINEPSPDNIGVYTDSVSGLKVLQFKEFGLSLPFMTGTALNVTEHADAVLRVITVTLNDTLPANGAVPYEYGVQVQSRHYEPGVQNSFTLPHTKFYGGKLYNIDMSGATISATDLDTMVDDIVAQINDDTGYTKRPAFQYPGAHVTAVAGAAGSGEFTLTQRYTDVTFEVIADPQIATTEIDVAGSKEILSIDEVFRVFSHLPNKGFLAQESWPDNMPLRDEDYVRINIDVPMHHYALDGASHGNFFMNAIELYVPLTEYESVTDKWEDETTRIMDEGTPDTTFAELLAFWQA